MICIHDDLFAVVDAVEVESSFHYSLFGEPRTLEAAAAADPLGGLGGCVSGAGRGIVRTALYSTFVSATAFSRRCARTA